MDEVFSQSKRFFSLPLDEKMKLLRNEKNRGYTPLLDQHLDPVNQIHGLFSHTYCVYPNFYIRWLLIPEYKDRCSQCIIQVNSWSSFSCRFRVFSFSATLSGLTCWLYQLLVVAIFALLSNVTYQASFMLFICSFSFCILCSLMWCLYMPLTRMSSRTKFVFLFELSISAPWCSCRRL